jgi:hypothetical protein
MVGWSHSRLIIYFRNDLRALVGSELKERINKTDWEIRDKSIGRSVGKDYG